MKIWILLFLFVLTLNGLAQTQVTFLTYDINHGEMPGQTGKPNLDSVAALINRIQPHFVLCQDVDSSTTRLSTLYGQRINFMKELSGRTGMNAYFGKAMDIDSGANGVGLMSVYMLQPATKLLSVDAGPAGVVLYANLRLENGQNVIIGSTQFSDSVADAQLKQAEQIDRLYRELLVPGVLTGNFNFEHSASPFEVMMRYFKDVSAVRKMAPATFPSSSPVSRPDYAFVTKRGNWKVISVETIPVLYSDHLPLLFTLEMTLNE